MNIKVFIKMDDYGADFYKSNGFQEPIKIGSIGNAGVANDFIEILRKLGHEVEIEELV